MSESGPAAMNAAPPSGIDDELAHYGIERVPADYFMYRTYRYTNLSDALAQAKLEQTSEE